MNADEIKALAKEHSLKPIRNGIRAGFFAFTGRDDKGKILVVTNGNKWAACSYRRCSYNIKHALLNDAYVSILKAEKDDGQNKRTQGADDAYPECAKGDTDSGTESLQAPGEPAASEPILSGAG